MNKTLRIAFIVALLIYVPFFALVLLNLIPPSFPYELSSFFREAVIGLTILSSVYLLFLAIIKTTTERFVPHIVFIFIFSYCLFVLGLVYIGVYQAPDLGGALANFSVIPSPFLLQTLYAISISTITLMFLMKINIKTLALILFFAMGISSGLILAKELHFRYKLEQFFGDYREGGIVFSSSYSTNNKPYIFYLSDRKFKRFSAGDFAQMLNKLEGWSTETLSPDSNFMAYEDSYDRDDLLKIFLVNKNNRKTILLAAGENPIWMK